MQAPFGSARHSDSVCEGPRINKIEAHPLEIFACDREGVPGLRGCMKPPEEAKLFIEERLHPKGNAIDAS